MKTTTWIILFVLLLAACLSLSIPLLLPSQDASYAEVTSQGSHLKTFDLSQDCVYSVGLPDGSYNEITVKDGKIAVTAASCPDHYCMERGFCSGGTQIVCLPNRLVIRFLGEQTVDGAVG